MRKVQSCLEAFCKASREKVNNDKTHMFVSRNVHSNVALELSREAGFTLVPDLGKYLGIPLHHSRVNKRPFQFLEEKLSKCLNKWRANSLSLAGRITLAKFVLNTVPVYYMQTNLLPNDTCEKFDKITRDFIWGFSDEGKVTHLVDWDKLCRHRKEGGVGLRKARHMNYAFLMKVGWGLINQRDSLWASTLRSKYECGKEIIPTISRRNCKSNLWQGVCKVWNKVLEGGKWKIGNGVKVNFWNDHWCNYGVIKDVVINPSPNLDWEENVSEFILPNGEWDRGKILGYLPENICKDILRFRVSNDEHNNDMVVWNHPREI